MRFGLTEEQRLFDDSLRAFLADRVPIETLRQQAQTGRGFDPAIWQGLCELGLPGLLVPESYGGAGLGVLDAALSAEALGHAAAPIPFAASAVMAPLAFANSASRDQQSEFLPRIAAGEMRVGMAFAGIGGQTGDATLTLQGNRLSGRVQGALDAGEATHLLVYLPDGRAALVEAGANGVSAQVRRSVDRTRPVTDLSFENAESAVLDAANDRMAAALRVVDAGRVMLAADTLGAAQYMLDQAVAWAKERVQFGRVIGSFQGVKHTLAEIVTMLEPCRAFVWHAAYAQDALPDEARLFACQVKAHVGDVGREASRMATEVHGGMGFTDLLGLHYWFKRCTFDRQMLGGPQRCREEAARLQGWKLAG
ncbi:MAG: acyl-CoA/acyl-ACP dehydrogenase [Alphaproteobacteria bacterium]|nr:acyl-CoA/acyl-ACP dehydrogenase [Alphaproteobacteria bacterium]